MPSATQSLLRSSPRPCAEKPESPPVEGQMNLESLATFLTEHPDWAPVLQENAGVSGVTGPTGVFVALETLDNLLEVVAVTPRRWLLGEA
jgi:hypothetical protein